jgi:hypothetical protein
MLIIFEKKGPKVFKNFLGAAEFYEKMGQKKKP